MTGAGGEKIDELRHLLDLHDRSDVSIVALAGMRETTTDRDSARQFADSGDRAYVFVGPKDKLVGDRRENCDGTVTYTFTMPQ